MSSEPEETPDPFEEAPPSFRPGWSRRPSLFSPDVIKAQIVPKYGKWIAYPLVYIILFCIFAYVTFPYERLKQRITVAYNASQAGKPEANRMRIGDITWSWKFPGVVLRDVQLIGPKPKPEAPAPGQDKADKDKADKKPKRTTIQVDEVYASVSLWGALTGSTDVDFTVDGFGGEVSGEFTKSDEELSVDLELSEVDPGQLPMVADALQLPVSGSMSGTIALTAPEGKYSKAEGTIELEISDLTVGDGKTKIRGLFALPTVKAGTLTIAATIAQGKAKVEKFAAKGPDLEIESEGRIRLRDELSTSMVEQMSLAFKFSDKYRDKNDTTRSLLGKPGDKIGGAIDLDPKVKRAKKPDGFYRWRISGPFSRLNFQPGRATLPKKRGARGVAPRKPPGRK